jgi:hypothetical protein
MSPPAEKVDGAWLAISRTCRQPKVLQLSNAPGKFEGRGGAKSRLRQGT